MKKVIVVDWWEYEEGWGSRPDGVSIHLTKELADKWTEKEIMNYSEYHSSDPAMCYEKEVSDEIYKEVAANGGNKKYNWTPW